MKTYAHWYCNSVEYGTGLVRKHYPWDKKSREKFDEKQLEQALNLAYKAGRQDMYKEFQEFARGLK